LEELKINLRYAADIEESLRKTLLEKFGFENKLLKQTSMVTATDKKEVIFLSVTTHHSKPR
jgi:hypothetical protein